MLHLCTAFSFTVVTGTACRCGKFDRKGQEEVRSGESDILEVLRGLQGRVEGRVEDGVEHSCWPQHDCWANDLHLQCKTTSGLLAAGAI